MFGLHQGCSLTSFHVHSTFWDNSYICLVEIVKLSNPGGIGRKTGDGSTVGETIIVNTGPILHINMVELGGSPWGVGGGGSKRVKVLDIINFITVQFFIV